MWVKICGTTTLQDAKLAIEAGADSIGFVFAESKRRVEPAHVATITSELPDGVERTGVFHAHTPEEIIDAARLAKLTSVQIHRAFDPEDVRLIRVGLGRECKLLQVISCPVEELDSEKLKSDLRAALTEPDLWGILLDASCKGVVGGTGQSFDWQRVGEILHDVWPERLDGHGPKLILAGGLHHENVQAAITALQPYGVDVVSGVERAPGSKDEARVRAFVEAARSC